MTTDELMAEVERLRGVLSEMRVRRDRERAHLVEAVRVMVCERNEARAQVKALQAEELARKTERDTARAEVDRLRAEVERLRAALAQAQRADE